MIKVLILFFSLVLLACGEQGESHKSSEKEVGVPKMRVEIGANPMQPESGASPTTAVTYGKQIEVLHFTITQHDVEVVTDTNGLTVTPWVPEIVVAFQYRGLMITDCTIYSSDGSFGDERKIKETHPPSYEGDKNEERFMQFHPGQPQFPKSTALEMTLKCNIASDGTLPDGRDLQYGQIGIQEVVVGIADVELIGDGVIASFFL